MKKLLLIILLWLHAGFAFCQEKIEMKFENGIYTIPCVVNDLRLRFIFDTGAANVSISAMEAGFMLKNGYLQESDFIDSELCLLADGSIAENAVINIRELKIGSVSLSNIKAYVVFNIEAPLLLGQSAISQLGKWYIDSNYLYLGVEPTEELSNLSEEEHYKLAIEYENKGNLEEAYKHLEAICKDGKYNKELVNFVLNNQYEKGYELASKLCLDMCLSGDKFMISRMYYRRWQLEPKNKKERLEFYRLLSESCSPIFYGYLADAYYTCSEPAIATEYISYLENAAFQIESYMASSTDLIISNEELKERVAHIYETLGDVYYGGCFDLYEPIFDKEKAFGYYEKVAQLSVHGMYKYGVVLYRDDDATDATKSEGIYWLTKAAEANYFEAMTELIDAYYNGDRIPENHDKAIEYCNQLLKYNDDDYYSLQANMYLGKIYYDKKEYNKAFKHLNDACEYIDIQEQNKGFYQYLYGTYSLLGDCYYFGLGTSVNYVKAYGLYLEELEYNEEDLYCIYSIAYMVQRGLGVQQNEKLAFELFQEGANRGHASCQAELAWCYYAKLGTSEDISKAIFWSKKAIENDNTLAEAHLLLGYIYESIYHYNYDISKAISHFEAASTNGSGAASYRLGRIYEYGEEPSVQRNYKLAKKYYSLAVEQGYSKAQEKLKLFE